MTTLTNTLSGKVALVTGGSRGIGAAIVKRLAEDGAAAAFTYSNSQQKAEELVKEIEASGGRALAIQADSANVDAVKNAVSETIKTFGKINILVNNAGLTRGLAPLGITVNNVQPGPTDTDMNPADGPYAPIVNGMIAIGRYGKGAEIASMVAYLATPEAAFATGSTINVDGGVNI